jgi:hypothetical protein
MLRNGAGDLLLSATTSGAPRSMCGRDKGAFFGKRTSMGFKIGRLPVTCRRGLKFCGSPRQAAHAFAMARTGPTTKKVSSCIARVTHR